MASIASTPPRQSGWSYWLHVVLSQTQACPLIASIGGLVLAIPVALSVPRSAIPIGRGSFLGLLIGLLLLGSALGYLCWWLCRRRRESDALVNAGFCSLVTLAMGPIYLLAQGGHYALFIWVVIAAAAFPLAITTLSCLCVARRAD